MERNASSCMEPGSPGILGPLHMSRSSISSWGLAPWDAYNQGPSLFPGPGLCSPPVPTLSPLWGSEPRGSMGRKVRQKGQAGRLEIWVLGPALLGLGCVTLGRSLPFSGPQYSHLHPRGGGQCNETVIVKGSLASPTSAQSEREGRSGSWLPGKVYALPRSLHCPSFPSPCHPQGRPSDNSDLARSSLLWQAGPQTQICQLLVLG